MSLLNNIKYVFQIPLEWFRRVEAFCFNSYGGNLIRITYLKDGSAAFDVDEKELAQYVPSKATGTPGAFGSFPTEVTQSAATLWTAGGADGATLLVLYKGTTNAGAGMHSLFAAKLTVSAGGLITKIEAVEDSGVEIMA